MWLNRPGNNRSMNPEPVCNLRTPEENLQTQKVIYQPQMHPERKARRKKFLRTQKAFTPMAVDDNCINLQDRAVNERSVIRETGNSVHAIPDEKAQSRSSLPSDIEIKKNAFLSDIKLPLSRIAAKN